MADIKSITENFLTDGEFLSAESFGAGHINDTYKVVCLNKSGKKTAYIIQRVNHKVFPNIEGLMQNILGVTEFIRQKKLDAKEDISRTLTIIMTKDGKAYCQSSSGDYFRCHNFLEGTKSIETSPTPNEMFISGVGYGQFQKYLNGYPANKLIEPIPHFHNTVKRLADFKKAVEKDSFNRVLDTQNEINFYLDRAHYADRIVKLLENKSMPLRVTHNDTKLNNILIDVDEEKAVAAIDLDTVMPGCIVYDFGDSIRSGANLAEEDEKDLNKVRFSLEHYEAFCKGFLGEIKDIVTDIELQNMAFGAILMTYECGMRFLSDHLNGDIYFKIHREGHNLDRARTQMKMVEEMEKVFDKMNETVYNISGRSYLL